MIAKPSEMISIKLRMKESLRRQIAVEAKKEKRSANQEMVWRLEQSFANPGVDMRNRSLNADLKTLEMMRKEGWL